MSRAKKSERASAEEMVQTLRDLETGRPVGRLVRNHFWEKMRRLVARVARMSPYPQNSYVAQRCVFCGCVKPFHERDCTHKLARELTSRSPRVRAAARVPR